MATPLSAAKTKLPGMSTIARHSDRPLAATENTLNRRFGANHDSNIARKYAASFSRAAFVAGRGAATGFVTAGPTGATTGAVEGLATARTQMRATGVGNYGVKESVAAQPQQPRTIRATPRPAVTDTPGY